MNATPSPTASSSETVAWSSLPASIDRSCRLPVLFLCTSAVVWLVIALLFAVVSSIKLHGPGFLSGAAWLTYGRTYPASLNALMYGFAVQAGLGLGLWLLARLGRTPVRGSVVITIAGAFWNLGVTIGFLGILGGDLTGFEWLDMPGYVAAILFGAYLLIGIFALLTLADRREPTLYVSQWFLLAGLLWFPWIYSTAQLLLMVSPVRGIMQEIVNGWYEHNLFMLWLSPVGMAVAFYFIPKLVNRPLHSNYLALFAFWAWALFGGWGALYVGSPAPRWISSVTIVANVLLAVPLLAVALNWHKTLAGKYGTMRSDWPLRFVVIGAAAFLAAMLLRIVGSLRSVAEVTQFTYYVTGTNELFLFGFVMMVIAGALFYVVPRLTEAIWPSAGFVKFYFWVSFTGVLLSSIPLVIGGVLQGMALNDASVPFMRSVTRTIPFVGLNTVGSLLLLVANAGLLLSLGRHMSSAFGCCQREGARTV